MSLQVRDIDLPTDSDKWKEITIYLLDHLERGMNAQAEQRDKMVTWNRNYRAEPFEKVRTLPWRGASNFVVPVIRMFIDTLVARTLNIIASTNPLYTPDFVPRDQRESVQQYLHKKAFGVWDHYTVMREMLSRGSKQGTAFIKIPFVDKSSVSVHFENGGFVERDVREYYGPRAQVIPFEDFVGYPVTVSKMEDLEIKYHRVRMTKERAEREILQGNWPNLTKEDIMAGLNPVTDLRRQADAENAGISLAWLNEMEIWEAEFNYELDGKNYKLIALISPALQRMLRCYYYPIRENYPIWEMYSPSPTDDFLYGEPWTVMLAQIQEEVSVIHNDRRNAAYIASAPVFKRRRGSQIPNPSTEWYPGKVFDVEDMNDFEAVTIGRNINDMLAEEMQALQLAERLVGIGPAMQGLPAGNSDKRGIYNTGGVLAVMAEGNNRQDTNLRDARSTLSRIGKTSFFVQALYGPDDSALETLPSNMRDQVRETFERIKANPNELRNGMFEIRASSAGMNKEIEKQALLQINGVLGSYAQALQQMSGPIMQAQGAKNGPLTGLYMATLNMAAEMAKRMLRVYDQFDMEGIVPRIEDYFGPNPIPQRTDDLDGGQNNEVGGFASRSQLQSIVGLREQLQNGVGATNLGM